MSNPTGSYVYVIGCPAPATDPVKIGWTAGDPRQRLADLRSLSNSTLTPTSVNRAKLEVLYHCDGDRSLERALHARFQPLRVMGEWFRLDPAVAPREVRMAISEMPHLTSRTPGKQVTKRSVSRPGVERVAPSAARVPQGGTRQRSAEAQYELFTSWTKAGFTEEQALRMIAMMVTESN